MEYGDGDIIFDILATAAMGERDQQGEYDFRHLLAVRMGLQTPK